VGLSLFTARDNGVLIKGQAIQSRRQKLKVGVSPYQGGGVIKMAARAFGWPERCPAATDEPLWVNSLCSCA